MIIITKDNISNYLTDQDINIIDKNILYGSWAGAFGNFQFMPRMYLLCMEAILQFRKL